MGRAAQVPAFGIANHPAAGAWSRRRAAAAARLPLTSGPPRYNNGHYCNEPPRRLQDVRHLVAAALLCRPSASPDGWPVAGWRSGSRRRSPPSSPEHAAPGDSSPFLCPLALNGCRCFLLVVAVLLV